MVKLSFRVDRENPHVIHDWEAQLKDENAVAAPQTAFYQKLEKLENSMKVGFSLAIPDTRHRSHGFVLAEIVDVARCWVKLHVHGTPKSDFLWFICNDPDLKAVRTDRDPVNDKSISCSDIKIPQDCTMEIGLFQHKLKRLLTDKLAPQEWFKPVDVTSKIPNTFKVGQKLEALDMTNKQFSAQLYRATVAVVQPHTITLTFDGFSNTYDMIVPFNSVDLFPCGFHAVNTVNVFTSPTVPKTPRQKCLIKRWAKTPNREIQVEKVAESEKNCENLDRTTSEPGLLTASTKVPVAEKPNKVKKRSFVPPPLPSKKKALPIRSVVPNTHKLTDDALPSQSPESNATSSASSEANGEETPHSFIQFVKTNYTASCMSDLTPSSRPNFADVFPNTRGNKTRNERSLSASRTTRAPVVRSQTPSKTRGDNRSSKQKSNEAEAEAGSMNVIPPVRSETQNDEEDVVRSRLGSTKKIYKDLQRTRASTVKPQGTLSGQNPQKRQMDRRSCENNPSENLNKPKKRSGDGLLETLGWAAKKKTPVVEAVEAVENIQPAEPAAEQIHSEEATQQEEPLLAEHIQPDENVDIPLPELVEPVHMEQIVANEQTIRNDGVMLGGLGRRDYEEKQASYDKKQNEWLYVQNQLAENSNAQESDTDQQGSSQEEAPKKEVEYNDEVMEYRPVKIKQEVEEIPQNPAVEEDYRIQTDWDHNVVYRHFAALARKEKYPLTHIQKARFIFTKHLISGRTLLEPGELNEFLDEVQPVFGMNKMLTKVLRMMANQGKQ